LNSLRRHQKTCQAWKDNERSEQREFETEDSREGKNVCKNQIVNN
jgi:hypothetical protein